VPIQLSDQCGTFDQGQSEGGEGAHRRSRFPARWRFWRGPRRGSGGSPRQLSGCRCAARLGESRGEVGVVDCFQVRERKVAGDGGGVGVVRPTAYMSFLCSIRQEKNIRGGAGDREEV
jgi:hypothetical protein